MGSREQKTVWLTTWCLTRGIRKVAAEVDETLVYCKYAVYQLGKEAFTDRAEAVADAEARRVRAIASTEKKLQKLKLLRFY